MKSKIVAGAVLLLVLLSATVILSEENQGEPPMKKGILLVAFGTTVPEARKAFDNIEKCTRERFPGVEVRWAFTSSIIRKKLAAKGEKIDSIEEALERMQKDGFSDVYVQSLHTIAGVEYDETRDTLQKFRDRPVNFKTLVLGKPLLASYADLERTVKVMLASVPAGRKADEAVIFMGHGSADHPSDLAYLAFQSVVNKLDGNAYMATVEGKPELADVIPDLKKKGIKKAYLIPFMSVAGDHAMNDMAGDGDESWKTILSKNGIETVPVMKGSAEIDGIVKIWLDHLEKAMTPEKSAKEPVK